MKRFLLVRWLLVSAAVLDLLGRKHSIRRRLGQLQRRPRAIATQQQEQAS